PKTLRAAVLFRAMVPLVHEKMPDLSSVRVWIGAGNQDPVIPTSETQRLVELLRSARAEVTIHFVNAGHGLTSAEVETASQWLSELTAYVHQQQRRSKPKRPFADAVRHLAPVRWAFAFLKFVWQ